jgi:hypothetical protein
MRLEDILVYLHISPDELNRWHCRGWTSFDASSSLEMDLFDDPKVWELYFVRNIVRSCLTDAQVTWLLEQIPKPYAFDPDRIVFSFRYGWLAVISNYDPEEIIEDNLDYWLKTCKKDRLKCLRNRIDELLNLSKKPDSGTKA